MSGTSSTTGKKGKKPQKSFWTFTSVTNDNARDAENLVIASETKFFPVTSAMQVRGRNHFVTNPIQISKAEYDAYPALIEKWEAEKKAEAEREN